jgi:hypothetical protein
MSERDKNRRLAKQIPITREYHRIEIDPNNALSWLVGKGPMIVTKLLLSIHDSPQSYYIILEN